MISQQQKKTEVGWSDQGKDWRKEYITYFRPLTKRPKWYSIIVKEWRSRSRSWYEKDIYKNMWTGKTDINIWPGQGSRGVPGHLIDVWGLEI